MPKKFIKAFRFARAGAEHAWKTQRNLWIHFCVGLLVLAFGVYINVSLYELSILILAIFGVIVAEMFNTSVEEMVNILSPERRKEAELAKNVAAGAVLLSASGAVLIGLMIFGARLFPCY
ncbi:MAG: diacylglycerol kinase family protein [Candidatus Margulisiibacteriota bacterium]|nr:diacylglycerol kinase family protein [Candidatus Margulisiibacteriota bacterium]